MIYCSGIVLATPAKQDQSKTVEVSDSPVSENLVSEFRKKSTDVNTDDFIFDEGVNIVETRIQSTLLNGSFSDSDPDSNDEQQLDESETWLVQNKKRRKGKHKDNREVARKQRNEDRGIYLQ